MMTLRINYSTLPFLLLISVSYCNEYIDDCSYLLKDFAVSSATFMACATSNARPITMCSECSGDYTMVEQDHKRILEISDSNNKTCKDRLINLDRLEIIEAGYSYVTELWEKGNCANCNELVNSRLVLSNSTLKFRELYNATDFCICEFYKEDNNTYDAAVCTNCSAQYLEMNRFYDHLKETYGDGKLCMDIVDAMNITQNRWSEVLHCGENIMTPEIPLIASFATILALPVLFYLSTWTLSSSTPSPVSMQKRLSTRLMERIRSRTGSMMSQFRH